MSMQNQVKVSIQQVNAPWHLVAGYAVSGLAAMALIAYYKQDTTAEKEKSQWFNDAKCAVMKDSRFLSAVGYPKEFKMIDILDEKESTDNFQAFRVVGDKSSALVTYKPKLSQGDESDHESGGRFETLNVELSNGDVFSALTDFEPVDAPQAPAKGLAFFGKAMLFPMAGGILIGSFASFFMIRIIRNRPLFLHKLAMQQLNSHPKARALLGSPIQSNRKDYVGTLSKDLANYSITCRGPIGEGLLLVQATKPKFSPVSDDQSERVKLDATSSWRFSKLILRVSNHPKRKDKRVQMINILSSS